MYFLASLLDFFIFFDFDVAKRLGNRDMVVWWGIELDKSISGENIHYKCYGNQYK